MGSQMKILLLKFDSFKKVKDVINFEKRQYVKM